MHIIPLIVGQQATNCYIISDENNCIIIDPGSDADYITSTVTENKIHPTALLLTHGHFDHCLATLELKLNFNIPIFLHQKDYFLYRNAKKSSEYWTQFQNLTLPNPDYFFDDNNQQLNFLDNTKIEVLHTPGHTPGSVCFLIDNSLFTGDLLFAEGTGRTDFSYSNQGELQSSLEKIRQLPKDTLIYPGHELFPVTIDEALSQLITQP